MKIRILILVFSLAILSGCRSDADDPDSQMDQRLESADVDDSEGLDETDSLIVLDVFEDSLHIGRSGKNKVVSTLLRCPDSTYVVTEFFSREGEVWKLKNHYEIRQIGPADPFFMTEDYTNDGFPDYLYQGLQAARLRNLVFRLFLYSSSGDSLVCIHNSTSYPNLEYNETLDCISSYAFTGTWHQSFHRIQGDSLATFARITMESVDSIGVYEVSPEGEFILLKRTANDYEPYPYFSNYNPLVVYETGEQESEVQ